VSCIAPTSSAANKVGYKRHRAPGAFFQQLRSQPDKVGYKRHWAPGTKVLLSGEIINQKSEIINKHAGCNTVADARAIFRQLRSQPDKVGYKRHRAPGTKVLLSTKSSNQESEIINKDAGCNAVADARAHIWATPIVETL
jgi:hypothetical protein